MKKSFRKFVVYPLAALMALAGVFAYAQDRFSVPGGMFTAGNIAYFIDNVSMGGASEIIASATGITIGSTNGTEITQILVATATVTSVTVAGNQCDEVGYSVSNVTTSDKILWNAAYDQSTEPVPIVAARVISAGTVELTFCNVNSAASDPVTGTVNLIAIRS